MCSCTQGAATFAYALGQSFSNCKSPCVVKLTWWIATTILKTRNRIEQKIQMDQKTSEFITHNKGVIFHHIFISTYNIKIHTHSLCCIPETNTKFKKIHICTGLHCKMLLIVVGSKSVLRQYPYCSEQPRAPDIESCHHWEITPGKLIQRIRVEVETQFQDAVAG